MSAIIGMYSNTVSQEQECDLGRHVFGMATTRPDSCSVRASCRACPARAGTTSGCAVIEEETSNKITSCHIMRASAMALSNKDSLRRDDALLYLVSAAVVTTFISIRVFEVLMAVALVTLIATRRRWRLPPVWLPLSLFLLGTLVSLGASGHIREGLPQVRKFYIYLMLLLVTAVIQS